MTSNYIVQYNRSEPIWQIIPPLELAIICSMVLYG